METLQQQIQNIKSKLERLKALKLRFNAIGWAKLRQQVNFDLNSIHDLNYSLEDKFYNLQAELQCLQAEKSRLLNWIETLQETQKTCVIEKQTFGGFPYCEIVRAEAFFNIQSEIKKAKNQILKL